MDKVSDPLVEGNSLLEKKISRRDFLSWIIKGGLFVVFSGTVASVLAYLWPAATHGSASEIEEVGRIDELPVWGAKKIIVGGSALLLIKTPKEFKAFSAICTHLGCLVDWDGPNRKIICPCHAGVFDVEGRNISGPPPKPLPYYQVRVADGKIFVKL